MTKNNASESKPITPDPKPSPTLTNPPEAENSTPAIPSERSDSDTVLGDASETNPISNTQASDAQYLMVALLTCGGLLTFLGLSLDDALPAGGQWPAYLFIAIGWLFFLLAAVSFSLKRLPTPLEYLFKRVSQWMHVSPHQLLFLIISPFLGWAAWLAAGDLDKMRQPWIAVSSWILAIAIVVFGSWRREPPSAAERWTWSETLTIIIFGLFAFIVRGLWLDQIPWLLTGDEGSVGLSAVTFIKGLRDNIFGVGWFSFPSLYYFIQSIPIRWLGQTAFATRLPSAIAGSFTVILIYWYARHAFGKRVAFWATAYLTTFHYHIHFSRLGLNNIWDGMFFVIVSGSLWVGWKTGRRLSFVAAGIALGLSQYFYTSSRLLIVMIPLWLLAACLLDRKRLRQNLSGLLFLTLGAVVTALPLVLFFKLHIDILRAPLTRVGVLGPWLENETRVTGLPAWRILADQFQISALAFTNTGLRAWYQPGEPMLLALPATLFVLGAGYLIIKLTDLRHIWLILWLLGAIIIGALSESTPAGQRYVFSGPAVALLIALPLDAAVGWLTDVWPKRRGYWVAIAALLIGIAMANDLYFYFVRYSAEKQFGDINTEIANRVADYLQTQETGHTVFFFGSGMGYYSHSTIPFLAPHVEGIDVPSPESQKDLTHFSGSASFLFMEGRIAELQEVERLFPEGRTFRIYGKEDILLFTGYEVEKP